MRGRTIRTILATSLWVVVTASTRAGGEPIRATPNLQYILKQMQKRLEAITNYRCTVITSTRASSQWPGRQLERRRVAFDPQGRVCIREEYGNLEASTRLWDGARSIEICEHIKRNGAVVYAASIFPDKYISDPHGQVAWRYLGHSIARMLSDALEDRRSIDVEPAEDGQYRLLIDFGYGAVTSAVVDPKRGYIPTRTERIRQGQLVQREDIKFAEIESGVWFPVEVWSQSPSHVPTPSGKHVPRLRFVNARINTSDSDRVFSPSLPDGSTVADEVRGLRYVVDHRRGFTIDGDGTAPFGAEQPATRNAAPETLATMYRLGANEALKRVGPAIPSARRPFGIGGESQQASEAALLNTVYVLQWGDGPQPEVRYTGTGFLKLSEVLQYVCGLGIAEYSGAEEVLNLRLRGDWVARQDAPIEECVRILERLVLEETGQRITFKKQRVDTPVVRATGIFQYNALPGASRENHIHLFVAVPGNNVSIYEGSGSGSLSQLLGHVENRTGRRFLDDTLSSDAEVSWSGDDSSRVRAHRRFREKYNYYLDKLLDNLARQTGLKLTKERRVIDEWHVELKR